MSIPEGLARLAGQWAGVSRLWLAPGEPVRESASTAQVGLEATGCFLSVRYTWQFEGDPQEGLLLLGWEGARGPVQAAWVDSWHNGDRMMLCRGETGASGGASVLGSYPAPEGPDWGWRVAVEPGPGDSLRIAMFNIPPGIEEMLAVEGVYSRRP